MAPFDDSTGGALTAGSGILGAAQRLLAPAVTALALATGAGLLVATWRPGTPIHAHWLGTGGLATGVAVLFTLTVLLRQPLERRWGRSYRRLATAVAGGTCVLAASGAAAHLRAVARGSVVEGGSFPNACLLAAVLLAAWTVASLAPARPRSGAFRRLARAVAVVLAGAGLVLAWIEAAGAIDYGAGRTADAIVVFGSKVRANGRASGSLEDRTVTACRLWKRGAAAVLVLSGGRAPGAAVSEPEAMRAVALEQGVPAAAIVLDEHGANTAASVANAAALARERGWHGVLAVSHDYHLARIRLLFEREGLAAWTVPAVETASAEWKVYAVAREVVAWAATWAL